jgi:hypothetical protein
LEWRRVVTLKCNISAPISPIGTRFVLNIGNRTRRTRFQPPERPKSVNGRDTVPT